MTSQSYLSTANLNLPKHHARKLAPKYIGPFKVTKVFPDDASSDMLETEEKGLCPIQDGMEVLMPLTSCGCHEHFMISLFPFPKRLTPRRLCYIINTHC